MLIPRIQSIIPRLRMAISSLHFRLIARNASILLAITLLTDGVTIPYIGFLARRLGVVGFGDYAVAMSFANVALMVIDMGTGKLLTQQLTKNEVSSPTVVGASLLPKPALTIASVLAAIAIGYGLGYRGVQLTHIGLAILVAATMAMAFAARAVFHSYQRMEYDVAGEFTERLITIAGGAGAVLAGFGVTGVLLATICGNLADATIGWVLVRIRFVARTAMPPRALVKEYLRLGFPLFVAALFATLYLRANVVILNATNGSAAAGLFNAAFQMLSLALYVPTALAFAIFPYFARLAHADARTLLRASRNAAALMACAGVVFAGALILISSWLIPFIYGERFAASVEVMRILALGLPCTFVSTLLIQVLIATNQQGFVGRATVVTALVNIALNILFDKNLGITGTAVIAAGTELLMASQLAYKIVKTWNQLIH